VLGDTPVVVPSGRAPAWLDAALVRGLARDPSERWASMDELLAELDRDLDGRDGAETGRRWVIGGVSVALVIGVAALLFSVVRREDAGVDLSDPSESVTSSSPPTDLPPEAVAAKKALAMVLIAPNGAERLNRAAQYIDEHGEGGGLGRLALAEATAAAEIWAASCPTAKMGLCLAMATGPTQDAAPTGCMTPGLPEVEVLGREPEGASEAQRLASNAVAHAIAAGRPDPGDAIVEQAWATLLPAAESIVADVALESYLALSPPAGADVEAVTEFLAGKRAALDEVVLRYDRLIAGATGFAKVVALTRRALARQALFDAIARIPVPPTVVGRDPKTSYCDSLAERVRPFANAAVEDFRACIDEAMQARLSSEYVEFCEHQIAGIEQLDRARVREVVRSKKDELRACYDAGLAKDPALAGELSVRFTIDASGEVSDSMIAGDPPFPDASVARCVEAVIEASRFPSPSEGSMTITYPFNFQPG
jgi:hypothetical protein